jgi:glycerol kinase
MPPKQNAHWRGHQIECFAATEPSGAVMEQDVGGPVTDFRVDGGAAQSDLLMQMQADTQGVPVRRPEGIETTALGAAFLAGLGVGVWSTLDAMASRWQLDREFLPTTDAASRAQLRTQWLDAIDRAKDWDR